MEKFDFTSEFLYWLAAYFDMIGYGENDLDDEALKLYQVITAKYPDMPVSSAIHNAIMNGEENMPIRSGIFPRHCQKVDHDAIWWAYDETQRIWEKYGKESEQ